MVPDDYIKIFKWVLFNAKFITYITKISFGLQQEFNNVPWKIETLPQKEKKKIIPDTVDMQNHS